MESRSGVRKKKGTWRSEQEWSKEGNETWRAGGVRKEKKTWRAEVK